MVGSNRHSVLRQKAGFNRIFYSVTLGFALSVVVIVLAIIAVLVVGAWPSLKEFGWGFLTTARWNPAAEIFGSLGPILGTVVCSLIAILVAVPLSFGVAMTMVFLAPSWFKRPLILTIELLAGVPSIIYGIWGMLILVPFLEMNLYPFLADHLGQFALLKPIFGGPPSGSSLLTAGLVLAVMILPFISSIMREVFEATPNMLREASYGLGATTTEVLWKVVLPYSRIGVVGGIMLGLGRALGETMAVTFVIGNAHRMPYSLLSPGTSISASLANEFNEATGELYITSLIALGLILYVISLVVLGLSRLMLNRLTRDPSRQGN
ncbi:MAG: phosphate ABC transporter permease subunit PstC [Candidatus Pacebacteria bacterium]|nr:phosphate ABC transporter permease subunit PstC [Candidatus Paceibacterota bacterium]